MRILIATWHRNLVGGTEKYLQVLMPGLLRAGHQVGLIHEQPFQPALEAIDPSQSSLTTWCLAEQSLADLMRSVSEWKPDIVYNQGLQDGPLENALLDNYPAVLFAHGYYGTCGTGSKCHAFPQIRPCKRRFGPACVVLHYPRRCGDLHPLRTWRTFQRQMERHSRLPDYQAVLVASSHMSCEYVNHGVSEHRVHLVPLPMTDGSPEAMPPASRTARGRILLIGRLTAAKGGHHLIQAIYQASVKLGQRLTLTVAGDGPERQRLQELAQRFQVDTEFTGWVAAERKLELLRSTDLLAVPSLWPEPFGLVGLEAACQAVPAVGYAVGGIPDWLIGGQGGELAPGDPPTVQGLADAIVRAFADPDHYAELCKGAWRLSRSFSLANHLSKLEQVLSTAQNAPAFCNANS
jgi:glycosyltransferase involved in cell wall biosynthesis